MVKCTKRQIRQLKKALRWKIPEKQRRRIQMVLLRESGMTQPAIAGAMGVSLSTVNRVHMAYDQGSIAALKPKPCGGRQRENMTMAEEKALLARFTVSTSGFINPHTEPKGAAWNTFQPPSGRRAHRRFRSSSS